MPPKNSGGWTKFPGGHKVIHRTDQTAFVRVVTPRLTIPMCRPYFACIFAVNRMAAITDNTLHVAISQKSLDIYN